MTTIEIYSHEHYNHLISAKERTILGVKMIVRSSSKSDRPKMACLRVESPTFISCDDLTDFVLENYKNVVSH
jgi:hypothetical protein